MVAPETKTSDPTERRIKKMSDLRETEKVMETQLTHLKNPHIIIKNT